VNVLYIVSLYLTEGHRIDIRLPCGQRKKKWGKRKKEKENMGLHYCLIDTEQKEENKERRKQKEKETKEKRKKKKEKRKEKREKRKEKNKLIGKDLKTAVMITTRFISRSIQHSSLNHPRIHCM